MIKGAQVPPQSNGLTRIKTMFGDSFKKLIKRLRLNLLSYLFSVTASKNSSFFSY